MMRRLDERGDAALEPLRNRRSLVVFFGFLSTIGDFSIAWHLIGLIRAIGSMPRLREALVLSAALGVESLIVNQGVKRVFRRQRPTTNGDHRFEIRTPRTSSFPSGHASSATFAAIILTSYTGLPWAWLWFAIAALIAVSRVVVRIHHPSDIVGGIVTGALLAAIAIPVIDLVL